MQLMMQEWFFFLLVDISIKKKISSLWFISFNKIFFFAL